MDNNVNEKLIDREHIESLQTELNELIMNNTDSTKSLLHVASVLFSSAIKCYTFVLGEEGVVRFLKMTLNDIESNKNNLH